MKVSSSVCLIVFFSQFFFSCQGGRTKVESLPSGLYMTKSNTIWIRCPIGWLWKRNKCQATESAKFYVSGNGARCPYGYRSPTKEEIMELMEDCDESVRSGGEGYCKPCDMQVKCKIVFGVMISGATSARDEKNTVWIVDFGTGYVRKSIKRGSRPIFHIGRRVIENGKSYPAVDILAEEERERTITLMRKRSFREEFCVRKY